MDTTAPALPTGWSVKHTLDILEGGIFDADGEFVVSVADWNRDGRSILAEVFA